MNLIIATCQQGHIQEQTLDVTQTLKTRWQIDHRELTCQICPQKLTRYMITYDQDNTCCCNLNENPPVIHYTENYPHGTHCCLTCLNSPNTIHCKRETSQTTHG